MRIIKLISRAQILEFRGPMKSTLKTRKITLVKAAIRNEQHMNLIVLRNDEARQLGSKKCSRTIA